MSHEVVSEIWHVQLPNGQAHRLTLDELDAAFEAGHIYESTPVLPPGATQWTTLGAAAGLGAEEPSREIEPAAQAAPSPAPPVHETATPTPVTMEIPGPQSLSPMAISATPSMAPIPDLPDVDFEAAHRSAKRKMIFGAIGAAVVLAAVGAVGVRAMNKAEAAGNTFHNAVSAPGPETHLSGGGEESTPSRPALTEEQKKKLEEADKARNAAAAAKRKAKEDAHPAPSKPFKGDDPFKKSTGNKFDPLNGSL
jgi:hypothetical protein